MKYKITSTVDRTVEQWIPIMVCPKCGYKTTSTNVCRRCPKTPADQPLTRTEYCHSCKTVHIGPKGVSMTHRTIIMEYSGKIRSCRTDKKKKFTPKDSEMQAIWIGRAVVFEK